MNYTIISYCLNEGESEPHGVMVQLDNGDTQYLTMDELKLFIKNREDSKKDKEDENI